MISRPSDPLEAVIARLRGANQPRIGDRSARLWWVCPFHKDVNPSLCVEPGSSHYKCFGCGASGDAIDFVRRLDPSISFKEAVAVTGGELAPSREFRPATPAPRRQPPARPEGWQAFARAVVEQAERLLWTPNGSQTLAYLQARGLTLDTIRAARLGLHPGDSYASRVFPDGNVFVPHGIVIPWFEGEDLALVNVRRPQAHKRYWALRGSRKGGIYPSRSVIVAGRPLVLAEGEMDALLLGQELADLTPVVTMGSASDKPKPAALGAMLGARPGWSPRTPTAPGTSRPTTGSPATTVAAASGPRSGRIGRKPTRPGSTSAAGGRITWPGTRPLRRSPGMTWPHGVGGRPLATQPPD